MEEKYNKMSESEKEAFTLGRESVLNDFNALCVVDAIVGFTTEEFKAIKKFFAWNNANRAAHGN